jgi:hypothetical protein
MINKNGDNMQLNKNDKVALAKLAIGLGIVFAIIAILSYMRL